MKDIASFLLEIEPFTHGVNGVPVKEIIYSENQVIIKFFSKEGINKLREEGFNV